MNIIFQRNMRGCIEDDEANITEENEVSSNLDNYITDVMDMVREVVVQGSEVSKKLHKCMKLVFQGMVKSSYRNCERSVIQRNEESGVSKRSKNNRV